MGQTDIGNSPKRDTRNSTGRQGPVLMIGMIVVGVAMMLFAIVGLLRTNQTQSSGGADEARGPLHVGVRVADFAFSDLTGKTVRLSDFKGRSVLINSWATWCPPCQREMPDLEAFYQQHQSNGFVVLAINAGETREQAAGFVSQIGMTFPVLLDPDEKFTDRYNIRDYPTSVLVGTDGLVKAVHIGLITPEQLDREILPLIQ